MKTSEEIEPVRHRLKRQVSVYIFMCVLAYRLLAYPEWRLQELSGRKNVWHGADEFLHDPERVERVQVRLGHQMKIWHLNLTGKSRKTLEMMGFKEMLAETVEVDFKLWGEFENCSGVNVAKIDHHDFGVMILRFMDLILSAAPPAAPTGKVIVNLSGGPREILIALTAASMALHDPIYKTTNWSDIDRELSEIELPHIARTLDRTAWQILDDLLKHEHTTLTAVAGRIGASGSTVSRQSAKLAGLCAVEITPAGRKKQIVLTLSGRVLLKCVTFLTDARSND